MKISCAIADDLLPLYVDDSCSEDSKAILEEHLSECPLCREKLRRMKNVEFNSNANERSANQTVCMAAYAQKVRRHRVIIQILITVLIIVLAFFLSIISQAFIIMQNQHTMTVTDIENGTVNLTMEDFICGINEINQYALFTNSTQIVVHVQSDSDFSGTVFLWKLNPYKEKIMLSDIDSKHGTCVFTNLTSDSRYCISFEEVTNGTVTVSGTVDFGQAFLMALYNFF